MGGYEATQKIREVEQRLTVPHHTPIIGLSGNARQEYIDRAYAAGMDDYVTKPYHESQIREKLSQHVLHRLSNAQLA